MSPELEPAGAAESYLGAIYRLAEEGTTPAPTHAIAAALGVTPAAVSLMLRRLARQRLVNVVRYGGATLTAEGSRRALRQMRRHRITELFLHRILGFGWHEVHDRTRLVERVVDDEMEERMARALGDPERCPHGYPIPGRDGKMPVFRDVPLLDLKPGAGGRLARVTTESTDELIHLEREGFRLGAAVVLRAVAPFGGPVTIEVDGAGRHLGPALASALWVEPGRRKAANPSPARRGGSR